MMSSRHVRTSAKAIIIQKGRLLAIRNHSEGIDWYILPGGGQRHGETLTDTLKRECMEEASVQIIPGDIIFIRDYIAANHEFAEEDGDAHQVEFMFRCVIAGVAEPKNGAVTDQWQTGVTWIPLEEIEHYAIYPKQLKELLKNGIPENYPVYLGDIN